MGNLRPPWHPGESGNLRGPTGGLFQMAADIRRRTGKWGDVGDVPHGCGGGEADSDGGGSSPASAARAPPRRGAVVGGSRLGEGEGDHRAERRTPHRLPRSGWRSCGGSRTRSGRRYGRCWRRRWQRRRQRMRPTARAESAASRWTRLPMIRCRRAWRIQVRWIRATPCTVRRRRWASRAMLATRSPSH